MRTAPTPWSNTRRAQSSSPSIGHINTKEKPLPSWNLHEMLTSYQEYGLLPPILSPTIPQKEDHPDDVPLSMLSPTLPTQFTLEHPAPKRAKPPLQHEVALPSQKVKVRWINKLNQPHPRFMLRMNFDREKYQQAFKSPVSESLLAMFRCLPSALRYPRSLPGCIACSRKQKESAIGLPTSNWWWLWLIIFYFKSHFPPKKNPANRGKEPVCYVRGYMEHWQAITGACRCSQASIWFTL